MFFKNVTWFRFPPTLALTALAAGLAECQLKPVGPLELASIGFISPFGPDAEALSHEVAGAIWLTVGAEERLLPGVVLANELHKKLVEFEEREGRKPGGRTRKRIKDDLVTELLPKAFVKPRRCDAFLYPELGLLAVNTSSRKAAETVAGEIRRALGSFPALPLNAEVAPRSVLTGWIAGEELPEGFAIGYDCELRDAVDKGSVVRVANRELFGEEVGKHLEAGMQCTRLAINDEHVEFVFGEDLVVRKLKLLDGAVDSLTAVERDDLRAELDARFALMSAELRRLFAVLERAFKLSRADGTPHEPTPASFDAALSAALRLRNLAAADGITSVTISHGGRSVTLGGDDEPDPLLSVAKAHVLETGKSSIAGLQRVLKIGYNRAARLIESLELAGLVSPPDAHGDRRVLTPTE